MEGRKDIAVLFVTFAFLFVGMVGYVHAASITLNPGSLSLNSGQTGTFTVQINGGIGPFNVQLYNVTGGRAEGGNFSVGTAGYNFNGAVGDLSSEAAVINSGYSLYLCAAGANYTFAKTGSQFSWISDRNDRSSFYGGTIVSIGHQTVNQCTASTAGASASGLAVAGIGLNETPGSYTVYNHSTSLSLDQSSLSYNISSHNSFVVIMLAGGGGTAGPGPMGPIFSVTLPSGCNKLLFVNNTDQAESAYIAVCSNQSIGSYQVALDQEDGAYASITAYVFSSAPEGARGTQTLSFDAGSPATVQFKAIATDLGISTHDVFSSGISTVTIAAAPTTVTTTTLSTSTSPSTTIPTNSSNSLTISLIPSATAIFAGNSVIFVTNSSGGTGSNNYTYHISGPSFNYISYGPNATINSTGVMQTGGTITFMVPGNYTVRETVIDSTGDFASSPNLTIVVLNATPASSVLITKVAIPRGGSNPMVAAVLMVIAVLLTIGYALRVVKKRHRR